MENLKLSIIIPAHNEEGRIEHTLDRIKDFILSKKYRAEIIICDDGSTDKTEEIVKKKEKEIDRDANYDLAKFSFEKRKVHFGKGDAVNRGLRLAEGEIILFMDADSSTDISEIDKLIPYFGKGYDIVIGSRYTKKPHVPAEGFWEGFIKRLKSVFEIIFKGETELSQVKKKQPWFRRLMARGGNLLLYIILGLEINDTRCGFKAYSYKAAKKVYPLQRLDGFGFDDELLVIAKKLGFKIVEVPVNWYDEEAGTKVKPIKDSLKSLFELAKIRYNMITGKYKTDSK